MVRVVLFVFLAQLFFPITCVASQIDWLDLANGAVILSKTSEYNPQWSALSLIDGTTAYGWCSAEKRPYPNTFVIELAQEIILKKFVIDNAAAQEPGYPGISLRAFKLYVSTTSPKEGFQLALAGEVPRGKRKEFGFQKPIKARWLKLVALSNWGHERYTEIMELEAYGDLTGKSTKQSSVSGVFDTNYNLLLLKQEGNDVEGCYDWDNGVLSGVTDGRVVRFEWRENGPQIGTAIMVLSSSGNFLNGLWYEKGRLQGVWFGSRVTDGRKPKCSSSLEGSLRKTIETTGRAILYGIYFDSDSAKLKPRSTETLQQVYDLLVQKPRLKLVVEGHTDSTNTAEYNYALSLRRAWAVVKWLTNRGISKDRLIAKGYGESRPVADNSTPHGRMLNRRVEIVVAK